MNKRVIAGQASRILACLIYNRGREIAAPVLHRVGSNKPHGFVASLSRRISDLRDLGYNVTCRRQVLNGQTRTYYKIGYSCP